MRFLAIWLVLLSACTKKPVETHGDSTSQTIVVDAAPSLTRVAFASFDKGQLIECVDVATTGPLEEVERRMADEQKINQPCAKAFADRITLALCTLDQRTDAGSSMKLTIAHYDFATVGLSDERMSECLAGGGSWNPLSRDSALFRKAKLEHSRKALQKAADKLNDQR